MSFKHQHSFDFHFRYRLDLGEVKREKEIDQVSFYLT